MAAWRFAPADPFGKRRIHIAVGLRERFEDGVMGSHDGHPDTSRNRRGLAD
jgi:hypothetical protein